MSLVVLSCTCGSAEGLARKVLREGKCPYWTDVPVFQGKDKFKQVSELIPQSAPRKELNDIYNYIDDRSSYVLIIGYTDKQIEWADVKHGDVASRLDGGIIAREFA